MMRSIADLERRASLGDAEAQIELYQHQARGGSRAHLETLALFEWILEGDPLLGHEAAWQSALSRYEAVRDLERSPLAQRLARARDLPQLYAAAAELDLTIKVHWSGAQNLDRDHSLIGHFELGQRRAPVSAPVAEIVARLERMASHEPR